MADNEESYYSESNSIGTFRDDERSYRDQGTEAGSKAQGKKPRSWFGPFGKKKKPTPEEAAPEHSFHTSHSGGSGHYPGEEAGYNHPYETSRFAGSAERLAAAFEFEKRKKRSILGGIKDAFRRDHHEPHDASHVDGWSPRDVRKAAKDLRKDPYGFWPG